MNAETIYLDANATTAQAPEVTQSMIECFERFGANPDSQHRPGQAARRRLEDAREGIAEILGAHISGPQADQLIFTSGGTEANNLALLGLRGPKNRRILVSAIEHPCVANAAKNLGSQGHGVEQIPVDLTGVVDTSNLEALLGEPAHLVSVMLANHETGALQPVTQLARLAHEHGALMHTDAVQVAGRLEVNFRDLGVDAMSVAAHKCHGPVGVGALILRHGVKLEPQLFGGAQQYGLRPGTENVALAVGMYTALSRSRDAAEARINHMQLRRHQFEETLLGEIEGLAIHCRDVPRLPQTSNVAFPGIDRQSLFMALDLAGVACSTGSACQSGSSEPSPTLTAMGCQKQQIDGSLRFSFSASTGDPELQEAARRIVHVYRHLRSQI